MTRRFELAGGSIPGRDHRRIGKNNHDSYIIHKEEDIQIAIDEVMIGREKRERMMSDEEKKRVSYHEAGHAFMGYILKDSEPPVKVSIIPRGEAALGFSQPKSANKKLHTSKAILAQISVLLGGRVAEKLIYEIINFFPFHLDIDLANCHFDKILLYLY